MQVKKRDSKKTIWILSNLKDYLESYNLFKLYKKKYNCDVKKNVKLFTIKYILYHEEKT